MSSVLAKFTVVSCVPLRVARYAKDEQGRVNYSQREAVDVGCSVKLAPVQGEPFGQATPSGSIEMAIHNSAAARVFLERYAAFIDSSDPEAKAPEFYVRLTPAEEVDNGQREA